MILAWLIIIMMTGGLLAWLAGKWNILICRWIALITLIIDFIIIIAIWVSNPGNIGFSQKPEWLIEFTTSWIPQFGINFHLALDGLSLILVSLTIFLGIISVITSWTEITEHAGFFHFNILWILAGITGVFLSLDLFLFYFFWEVMLIPMYFLIGIWGHENRVCAAFKFLIFTQASGLLMFLSILALYFIHGKATGVYTFCIDVYDILQAVEDGATVRIYYESRLAKIELSEAERKEIDKKVEDITEGDELSERQFRFAKWTSKEAVVGSEQRLQQVAADMVNHFEQRLLAAEGKAMFVCMSRRICVSLHNEIIKLRPHWYDAADDKGSFKVIMTGSASDPLDWQEHIRNKQRRIKIGDRLKDPADPLKLVIVRDMWLTGFDAPCLHTLYLDKPMNGHNLMQAIARVNRVFGDKEGGLVVDYIGIAQDLKKALAVYTESKGRGSLTFDQEEAVARMQELYEIVVDMFHGFEYRRYFTLESREKLSFILDATNYIAELSEEKDGQKIRNGKVRFQENVTKLQKAFAISVPHQKAFAIRDDLAFFQAIKARFSKLDEETKKRTDEEIETAIRQIINDAIISQEVIDIFDAAGMKKPDISILSDEFLAEIQGMPRKNLALELLKRLLKDEIKSRAKTNLVQGKKFSELLAEAVKRYQNGLLDSAQVIEELIKLAQQIREADKRGEELNLRTDELAFYDALADNPKAESVLGDQTLKMIAHELVDSVRRNTSIDWQIKESVQAKLRVLVKRILRKYKYPPDDPATGEYTVSVTKVLDQAELLAEYWSEN